MRLKSRSAFSSTAFPIIYFIGAAWFWVAYAGPQDAYNAHREGEFPCLFSFAPLFCFGCWDLSVKKVWPGPQAHLLWSGAELAAFPSVSLQLPPKPTAPVGQPHGSRSNTEAQRSTKGCWNLELHGHRSLSSTKRELLSKIYVYA